MLCLKNNFKIPTVLLGTYRIKEEHTINSSLDKALLSGYRGFDTAPYYENEALIGEFFRTKLSNYNIKREDLFITTKLSPADQGYDKAAIAIKRSLENLQLDYIDLYLIHWPGTFDLANESKEHLVNRKGSWKALEEALKSGHIRNIGVSNYMIKHLEEMKEYATTFPAVNQIECHPYLVEHQLIDYCQRYEIHVQVFASLGSSHKQADLLENETVKKISSELHKSPAQILLKWAVNQGFSVLPRSTNPKHIESNIQLFDWELSDTQMADLFALDRNCRFFRDPYSIA